MLQNAGELAETSPGRETIAPQSALSVGPPPLTEPEEALQDCLSLVCLSFDGQWRFTDLNRQAEHLLGRTAGELLGKSLWEEYPNYLGTSYEIRYRTSLSRSLSLAFEAFDPYLSQWCSIHTIPAQDGLSVSFAVLTARKQLEEERDQLLAHTQAARAEAEAARQHLHDLFMLTPAAICVVRGPEHVFELANPLRRQLAGNRELVGKPIREAQPELAGQGWFELLDQAYSTGKPVYVTERKAMLDRHNDGKLEKAYFNYVFQPTRDTQGAVNGILAIGVDVTKQVHARQKIQVLDEQKDTFIGVVSHELKTPVTSLKTYTELLQWRFEHAGDTSSAQIMSRMNKQIDRLTALIQDLLDVTQLEIGQLRITPTLIDLSAVVRESVETMQQTTSTHTILIEEPITPLPGVQADPKRIAQVITNLLSNTIKYSPPNSQVIVKLVPTQHEIRISVQDYGSGIAKEAQKRLFQRFFRVDGTLEETQPGLGLGLYIASEIVARHGGHLEVESVPGQGSTFFFTLPTQPIASA